MLVHEKTQQCQEELISKNPDKIEHLGFAGFDATTEGGGAGGIGSGALGPTSTGALRAAGRGSSELLLGFSGAV